MPNPASQPAQTEIIAAQQALAKLTPGFLPFAIFLEFARLMVLVTIEMVPLRRTTNGEVEVLLVQREADDPYWPNMYHVPGTVLRASDAAGSYEDAFKRILQGELQGTATSGQPQHLKDLFHQVKRGRELALVHYIAISDEPVVGTFYPVSALPDTIVDHQIAFIQEAAQALYGQA